MRAPLILILFLFFSLQLAAQSPVDSLKKMQFMMDVSLGAKTITLHDFNYWEPIKMPSALLYLNQSYGYGKPFNYFLSADIGFGLNPGALFDSKKTFLTVVNYGVAFHKSFSIKKKFIISPFSGWQNAVASGTFAHFIQSKSSVFIVQNNFIVFGCDFCVFPATFYRSQSTNLLGIKIIYNMPLENATIKEGSQFFPSGLGAFSLRGFTIGLFCRLN